MDELAGRYLTLCLRMSRLIPGLIEWYAGPDRLLASVHSEPRRLPDRLASEADRLVADVVSEATLPTDRTEWLTAQLVALGTLGRARNGDVLGFREHVRRVLDVDPEPLDEQRLEDAHARLDGLLPGSGRLAGRLARFRQDQAIPASEVAAAFGLAGELLRPAARDAIRMPEDEHVVIRQDPQPSADLVVDRRPAGHVSTRVELGTRAATPAEVVRSAGRTTYPGHHTYRVLRSALLVDQFGRGECTLAVRWAPEHLTASGAVDVALDAVVPRHEQELAVARVADRAGVDADAPTDLLVLETLDQVEGVLAHVALAVQDDRADRAHGLLERWWVDDRVPAEQLVRSLRDRDTAVRVLGRALGRDAAGRFVTKQETPRAGFRRLVTEQLTPSALLAGR